MSIFPASVTSFRPIRYFQYGFLGGILGHEITHGFDNDGKYYNIKVVVNRYKVGGLNCRYEIIMDTEHVVYLGTCKPDQSQGNVLLSPSKTTYNICGGLYFIMNFDPKFLSQNRNAIDFIRYDNV